MIRLYKKGLLIVAVIAMVFSNTMINIKAETEDLVVKEEKSLSYEIYPVPHSTNYSGTSFVVREEINALLSNALDEPTLKRFNSITSSKGLNVVTNTTVVPNKTNIILGVYGKDESADQYILENYKVDEALFEKTNSYFLAINNGEIVILGNDTDAVFYGLTTLMHIFNQMESSTVQNLEIEDYADTAIRGFIEGYYGIPWTNEDRISLMEFGGNFKMTSYIFAPKDDPYHTKKWRELYPEEELEGIREMAQAGVDSKTKFVWTAHPFMGGFNANDVDGEIAHLINKFEQLYDLGVRQFGVLGDDVGNLDLAIIVKIMNELSEWGKEKGDLYDFVFCPAGYNTAWANWTELDTYNAGFPDDVQIFWTGDTVCAPITVSALNNFRNTNASEARRSPLFWLNWPVNDINMNRLLMGKGEMLHTDINVEDLAGVVTNPMQDAEPSKVSLFAIADYAWNVKSFDDDQSWKDSFKYIDADASEELDTLAQHMSDPDPNGHKLKLEESEALAPLFEAFTGALKERDPNKVKEVGRQLQDELIIIEKATKDFITKSNNARMVEQITPFANSLSELVRSASAYIDASIAVLDGDNAKAWDSYSLAMELMESSKHHNRQTRTGVTEALPGSKRLRPFVETVSSILSKDIDNIVGDKDKLVLTAETNLTKYDGDIKNVIDGNKSTHFWSNMYEAVGQYIQVNLSKPTKIYGVNILNGTQAKPADTFGFAKVQYTLDNENWIDMDSQEFGPYMENVEISDVEIEDVVAVRYIATQTSTGKKWPAMREFEIYLDRNQNKEEVERTVFISPEWGIYEGSESALFDDSSSTGVWYHTRYNNSYGEDKNSVLAGDIIGIELSRPITLGEIFISGGKVLNHGDYLKNFDLEYSMDGVNYTLIQSYTNTRDARIDLSDQNIKAKFVRLRATKDQPTWVGFNTFSVKEKETYNGTIYTNVDSYQKDLAHYTESVSTIKPKGFTLEANEYIGLQLSRIRDVIEVNADFSDSSDLVIEVSANTYEWSEIDPMAEAHHKARFVRVRNKGTQSRTFDLNKFEVKSFEFYPFDIVDTNYTSIYSGSIQDLFDNDWTTAYHFAKAQVKGDYFIVDFGQEIDLESLKIVNEDSSFDYIRDAVVTVSLDKQTWSAPVLTIGDQQANPEDDHDQTINDVFPDHEVSYNTVSAQNINQKARYLKLEITQDYKKRWVRINEIEVNGGAYIPSVNNPTFTSTSKDTFNGFFENLTDGSVMTSFIPADDQGNLLVSISEDHEFNNIKVIRDNNFERKAKASVRVYNTEDETTTWLLLGDLTQSINEFAIENKYRILDVKLEWQDGAVGFAELMRTKSNYKTVDKTELNKLLSNKEDTTLWTSDSIEQYEKYLEAAEAVKASEYSTQASIDGLVNSIKASIDNHKEKGNVDELQKLIDDAKTDSNNYTKKSWKAYTDALAKARIVIDTKDNQTQENIDLAKADIVKALNALVFNNRNKELLQVKSEDLTLFIQSVNEATENEPNKLYSVDSFNTLADMMKVVSEKLNQEDITPSEYHDLLQTLNDTYDALVDVSMIHTYVSEFESYREEHYSVESYKVYKDAIDKLKEALVSGTDATIMTLIADTEAARDALEFAVSEQSLKDKIVALKSLSVDDYTSESYKEFKDELLTLEQLDLSGMSIDELLEVNQKLDDTKGLLVNVVALKDAIILAEQFDETLYTVDSYQVLKDLMVTSETVLKEGTKAEVDRLLDDINKAITELKLRVDKGLVQTYLDSLTLKESDKYEPVTYGKYIDLYTKIKGIISDNSNVSLDDFYTLVDAFEEADDNLVLLVDVLNVDKLKETLAKAKKIDSRKYTVKSYEVLAQAIIDAEALLDQFETLRSMSQTDIDTMTQRLVSAMDQLVLKETTDDGSKVPDKDGGKDNTTPPTGINNPYMTCLMLISMSALVLIILKKKRRA